MTKRKILTTVIYFLWVLIPVSAQEYIANVQHFGVERGLSHREVFCTFQDSRGFVWMGTKYGLNRFDGHRFRMFTKEKDGLASNQIQNILEDADGWLWMLHTKDPFDLTEISEIFFLHIYSGKTMTWKERFGEATLFGETHIYIPKSGLDRTIYFGTKNGRIFTFNSKNDFKTYTSETN